MGLIPASLSTQKRNMVLYRVTPSLLVQKSLDCFRSSTSNPPQNSAYGCSLRKNFPQRTYCHLARQNIFANYKSSSAIFLLHAKKCRKKTKRAAVFQPPLPLEAVASLSTCRPCRRRPVHPDRRRPLPPCSLLSARPPKLRWSASGLRWTPHFAAPGG
jgi:hypothetical protein